MAIVVFRTSDMTTPGRVSDYGNQITDSPDVGIESRTMVRIAFQTKQSRYSVFIEPDSFAELATLMMKASPNDAIKAFGGALQAGIEPPNSN